MKTAKTIGKAAVLALLVFMGLFTACQSTGSVKRDSEAVQAFERGETLYKKGALKEAIAEYTKAIEIEPKWAEAFIMRGYVHGWNDDLDLALEDYESATTLDNKYRDFAQAFRYYEDGDHTRAIETLDKIIRNKINLTIAYNLRGNSYNAISEFEKAIADCTEAIRLNPEFYGNYVNRASNYNLTEQYDRAIVDCDRAIRLYPDNFSSYLVRSEAHLRKENTEKALADINRAIQLNPDNKGGFAFYPYFLRGFILYSKDDFPRAIADFSQVIQLRSDDLNPYYVNSYLFRGDCYLQTGDYDKATADIDTALRLDPGNEDALYVRGEIRAARAAQ